MPKVIKDYREMFTNAVEDIGIHHGLQCIIGPVPEHLAINKNCGTGTHNGYVYAPKLYQTAFEEYLCFNVSYNNIDPLVDVHGGLTFSLYGWVGFDTCHPGDNPDKWNKQAVIDETIRLAEQLSKLTPQQVKQEKESQ